MEGRGLPKMSLIAQYDDLCRYTAALTKGCEKELQEFAEGQLNFIRRRKEAELEVRNMNEKIASLETNNGRLETKIKHLKSLLDEAVAGRKKVESEKNNLARQIEIIKDVLLSDNAMDNQTKEKLAFLSSTCKPDVTSPPRLQTIEESMGSLFSPSDIDQTDDDLDPRHSSSRRHHRSHGKRSSSETRESPKKKKRGDVELNTPNVKAVRPIKNIGYRCNSEPSSSSPENPTAFPQDQKSHSVKTKFNTYEFQRFNTRSLSASTTPTGRRIGKNHLFVTKTGIKNLKCYPCGTNIGYWKPALKCQNCRMICHPECREKCPQQCIPLLCTPTKGSSGTIADYTSSTCPMIPPLIVHCVNEIESRGLKEVGLYRISGSDREVKSLKEKFINGRNIPSLNDVDIHAVCGTVKQFLGSLKEPLITRDAWQTFADAAEVKDKSLSTDTVYGIVCVLPTPNRDTLSFLMLHLQKIAESPDCKMSIENLAKIFGPTLIGYSEQNPTDKNLMKETAQQYKVMQRLLSIPSEKWQNLLSVDLGAFQGALKRTPENLPPPKGTRLGPFSEIQKTRTMSVGRKPLSSRNTRETKSSKTYFSSPLIK